MIGSGSHYQIVREKNKTRPFRQFLCAFGTSDTTKSDLEKSSFRNNGTSLLANPAPQGGSTAHAMPPHYLYGTPPTKIVSQTRN